MMPTHQDRESSDSVTLPDRDDVFLRPLPGDYSCRYQSLDVSKASVVIGRGDSNDFVLDDTTVSMSHLAILKEGACFSALDLRSRNGTIVNGEAVSQKPLRHGDVIEVGVYRLVFCQSEMDGAPACVNDVATLIYLSGSARGYKQVLDQVSQLRCLDQLIAQITHRVDGYVLVPYPTDESVLINGRTVATQGAKLRHNDVIDIPMASIQFQLSP